jgi:hypothetical protein
MPEGQPLLLAKARFCGQMAAPPLGTCVDEALHCARTLLGRRPPLRAKVWVLVTTAGIYVLARPAAALSLDAASVYLALPTRCARWSVGG